MKLYISNFCPFCHSVRLTLAAKKIDCEIVTLNLDNKRSFPELLSPYGWVPVLEHNGARIFESSIINEYLEEVFPYIALLPAEHVDRAEVRFWIEYIQTRLVSAYFDLMNCEDPQAWVGKGGQLTRCFDFLERKVLKDDFLLGSFPSLADISLYPWIERFVSATRYRGVIVPVECFNVQRWIRTMSNLDFVNQCAKTEAEYIDFFDRYWQPME